MFVTRKTSIEGTERNAFVCWQEVIHLLWPKHRENKNASSDIRKVKKIPQVNITISNMKAI